MHSSRMRTARLLTVSPSMHCSRGEVSAPGGVVCSGGVYSGGCLLLGDLLLGGVCSREGVCWQGGVCSRGCLLLGGRELVADTSPVDRIIDTRLWKYYLAPTSLRTVTRDSPPKKAMNVMTNIKLSIMFLISWHGTLMLTHSAHLSALKYTVHIDTIVCLICVDQS